MCIFLPAPLRVKGLNRTFVQLILTFKKLKPKKYFFFARGFFWPFKRDCSKIEISCLYSWAYLEASTGIPTKNDFLKPCPSSLCLFYKRSWLYTIKDEFRKCDRFAHEALPAALWCFTTSPLFWMLCSSFYFDLDYNKVHAQKMVHSIPCKKPTDIT